MKVVTDVLSGHINNKIIVSDAAMKWIQCQDNQEMVRRLLPIGIAHSKRSAENLMRLQAR